LNGRVLSVTIAKPMAHKLGSKKAIWDEGDDFFKNRLKEDGTEVIADMENAKD
jgi:hypothetical protein